VNSEYRHFTLYALPYIRARASTPFLRIARILHIRKKIAQEGTSQRAHFERKSDDDFSVGGWKARQPASPWATAFTKQRRRTGEGGGWDQLRRGIQPAAMPVSVVRTAKGGRIKGHRLSLFIRLIRVRRPFRHRPAASARFSRLQRAVLRVTVETKLPPLSDQLIPRALQIAPHAVCRA